MKKIEAIIRPFKLEDIKEALDELGIRGMTVTEVNSFGQKKGQAETFRGKEYSIDYMPKLKLEVVVPRRLANRAVKAVVKAAKSIKYGDGEVRVSVIDKAIRIRTGEQGDHAL